MRKRNYKLWVLNYASKKRNQFVLLSYRRGRERLLFVLIFQIGSCSHPFGKPIAAGFIVKCKSISFWIPVWFLDSHGKKKSHPGTLPFSSRGEIDCCKNTSFFSTCKGFWKKSKNFHPSGLYSSIVLSFHPNHLDMRDAVEHEGFWWLLETTTFSPTVSHRWRDCWSSPSRSW